jgi:hypothetical protein
MITTAIKSYFLVIVALGSIMGSAIAAPHVSNLVNVGGGSSDPSSLIHQADAQKAPYKVDQHLKINEKAGDPLRIEENINDAEQHCEMACKYIEYKPGSNGKAALAFTSSTPLDLSGAKKVHFFLMGENGGEKVKVKIAGKDPGVGKKADPLFKEKFELSTDEITLPNDWKRYEVPLDGVDLTKIKAPFGMELLKGKGSAQQVVYLKYIVYENAPVDERFLLPANSTSNATTTTTTAAATAANGTANGTTADSTEAENEINDNNDNETAPTSSTNNSAAGPTTSGVQTSNSTDIAPTQGQSNENLAPSAMLVADNLVAHPGDRVVIDGSLSSDPNGDEITYHWSQSDGPDANIIGADTVTPTVTIPTLDQNDQIMIDLVVSDGQTESNKASVVIDVQYVEDIEGAIIQDLPPDDHIAGQGWSDAECGSNGGIVECLADSSDSTFVSSDRPDITTDLLFSFQDPSTAGINSTNNIAYVTAQVTAKKTGASGFTSLIIDDPARNEHYSTPSISIVSDSFEEYSFTWKNNPVTGEPWTVDSLNSLVAGYRYLAGQGSIQISELELIVGSLVTQVEQDPSPPPPSSSAIDGETSTAEESEATAVGDNDDDDGDSDDEGTTTNNEEPAPSDSDLATDEGDSAEDDE